MKPMLALLDIGGSAIKLSCSAEDGSKVISRSLSCAPNINGRSVSINPDILWQNVIDLMHLISEEIGSIYYVSRLYVSTLRQGFTLVRNGKEITPLVYNSDTSGEAVRVDFDDVNQELLYRKSGHWFSPQLTLPKLVALKKDDSQKFSDETWLAFFHDWVIWKLTNAKVNESTLLASGQLWNLETRTVNYEILNVFDLPISLISEMHKFGDIIGRIDSAVLEQAGSAWANCQIMTGGGDSHFLHFGAAQNRENVFVISAGSSTPISFLSASSHFESQNQPWISPTFIEDIYFAEGNLGYPGSLYGWLESQYPGIRGEFEDLDNWEVDSLPIVLGSCREWTHEAWRLRPPLSIENFSSEISGGVLGMALMLDYAICAKNQILSLSNNEKFEVILTGGGANEYLARFIATFINKEVHVKDSSSASLDALIFLESGESTQKAKVFEPLNRNIQGKLFDFEQRHTKIYQEVQNMREVIPIAN